MKTEQLKPSTETLEGVTCWVCRKGKMKLVKREYKPLGILVWVGQCKRCGEIVYPPETSRFLEERAGITQNEKNQ